MRRETGDMPEKLEITSDDWGTIRMALELSASPSDDPSLERQQWDREADLVYEKLQLMGLI